MDVHLPHSDQVVPTHLDLAPTKLAAAGADVGRLTARGFTASTTTGVHMTGSRVKLPWRDFTGGVAPIGLPFDKEQERIELGYIESTP